ncbi:S8 family serine peptidase [Nonomuraea sp. 3N208]|uniref:S8 family serine peptidase n=1 Tax=Nonomuraea sp. 3N208 TaxID=3457421 RepID=UPI003FCE0770
MTNSTGSNNNESRPRSPGRGKPAQQQEVQPRTRQYMAAVLPRPSLEAMGVMASPMDAADLRDMLERDTQVQVLRHLEMHQRAGMGPMGVQGVSFPSVTVVQMSREKAESLRRQLPQVHVERDRLLTYTQVSAMPRRETRHQVVQPLGIESTFTFLVTDPGGKPVPDVTIMVNGYLWPAQTVTGADGRGTVTMTGETPESIASVLVKPRSGYWSRIVDRPDLRPDRDNLIVLKRLSDTLPGFPDRQLFGWGQQAMQLHRLPPTFRGAGVKIAVVDSGAAVAHPDLAGEVVDGCDLSGRKAGGWKTDKVHHGSHCAGVITGADNGQGIVGFAVEAEVYACKIFPGGRLSDLIEALNYCIAKEIDVVNLSLGTKESSPLVAAKIEELRNAGVACVVAAGNDGGPVSFPGNLPTVLTVAAIGKADTFPADSTHADQIRQPRTGEGYFSAEFTCFGPEIDVCAPGVAVVSAIPPDGYAAWDGTSMATPHVTGLAALVLAHHVDFTDGFRHRDARRVDRLFQIMKSSCTPLNFGDPLRTGMGLPDAVRALAPSLPGVIPQPSEIHAMMDQLTSEMILAGLSPGLPQQTIGLTAVQPGAGVYGGPAQPSQEMYGAGLGAPPHLYGWR